MAPTGAFAARKENERFQCHREKEKESENLKPFRRYEAATIAADWQ